MEAGGQPDPSAFQLEVARLFFALPASRGFLLAGGAALLAQHLTRRPTEDLDFFTAPERGHVPTACDALEEAAL
jgi:Nucleotidyl transferase AbiEii toxin, Type IV TA system